MKKFLPVFLSLCLFSVFYCSKTPGEIDQGKDGPAGVQFLDLSIPDALVKAEAENKIVLVDFFSPT
jgi:hypothetical protein